MPRWVVSGATVLLRLAQIAVTTLVASFLTFSLLQLAPGDPVTLVLGSKASDPARVAAMRAEFHLDMPWIQRYFTWLGDALQGNFGTSYIYHDSVSSLIAARVPTTVFLATYGAVLVLIVGFALGLWAARSSRAVDTSISTGLAVALATPSYVMAIVLITIFSLYLDWFPVFGSGEGFWNRLYHLTLPALTLALSSSAAMARITRASVKAEANSLHVTAAIVRGFTPRDVLWRHVVRNALLPITTIAGITVASMIAGTVIVEQAFGLNGIGSLLVGAVNRQDYPLVLALTVIIVLAFLVINAVVDFLYILIDPRTRTVKR